MTKTVTLPRGMPHRMSKLPTDEVGRPVPWFVEYVDGKPDFRIMNSNHLILAIRESRCWLCGYKLDRSPHPATFVAGPMCLINRTSAEPPSHRECAEWSVKACPFLSQPRKVRRQAGLPETKEVPGIMLARNPGVTALIDAERWRPFEVDNGMLFTFSYIRRVTWHAEGRAATPREIVESVDSGLPALREMAEAEGPEAMNELDAMLAQSARWIPTLPEVTV